MSIFLISKIVIWNILQIFSLYRFFYFKDVTSSNTQYKEAALAVLWKIIIKENNTHI